MTTGTPDLFGSILTEIANGPRLTDHADRTGAILRRLAEKGMTLEQCAGRKIMNRSVDTLKRYCREFSIAFPDFIPANMMRHIELAKSGDFLVLTGKHVDAVSAALEIVVTNRNGEAECSLPIHAFDEAKKTLLAAGFKAKRAKASKVRRPKNG